MQDKTVKERIDKIVDGRLEAGNFRHEVAHFVPEGSTNVLEYGFGDASLLLGLRRDKKVKGIYGVEVDKKAIASTGEFLDKSWLIDLNDENSWLEPEYEGFFNYILAPMSLEHTYDPWYVLKKFNKYLSKEGRIIVEVPNVQSWECIYRVLTGDFPYVSGGTWDFTHIRWYTLKSLIDICAVAGLNVKSYMTLTNSDISLDHIEKRSEIKTLQLPPPELGLDIPPISIVFPVNIKPIYPLFLSHALVLELEKVREPEDYEPTRAGAYLESYRLNSSNPFEEITSLLAHPIVPTIFKRSVEKARELQVKIVAKS